ncbi:MAG: GNVR domain-containing protein, partial [Nitrospinaceae bacterium]
IFTLIATGTAVLGSSFLPKEYEAKSTVLVSSLVPPTGQQMGFLSIGSYEDLAMTSGILQGVIDRLTPNYPNIKNLLFPKILERMISIDTGVAEKSQSLLMSFRVRGQNPLLIRDIANTIANLLSEVSGQIKKSEIKSIADTTNTQFISIKKMLSESEKTLNTIRAENKLPSLLAELFSMKDSLVFYDYEVAILEVQLNTESVSLAAYQKIESKLSEFIKTELIRAEINIKTLLAKKKWLTKSIKQLKKMIPLLENKTRAMSLKEKQISRKTITLEEQYFLLSNKVQEIRIAEAEKTGDIKLISKAIEPHFPVSPNRFKIILTALVFSLVAGMAAALAKEHLDTARQNTKK